MPKTSQPAQQIENPRVAPLVGLLLALIVCGGFLYIAKAHPGASLLLALLLAAVAVVAVLRGVGLRGGVEQGGSRFLCVPVVMGVGLALFAAGRWCVLPITYAGRPWVIDLQWFAVALCGGVALPAALRAEGMNPAEMAAWLRRWLTLALIGFALQGIYQRYVTYPAQYAAMLAEQSGPVRDLMTQSLLHYLQEGRVAGGFGNPNLFAAALALLTLFAIATQGRREPKVWRVVGWAGLGVGIAALWLTGSRGGVLTLLLVLAMGFGGQKLIRAGGRARRVAGWVIVIGAGVALYLSSAAQAASWMERLARNDTIRERLFYWQIALKIWKEHWLLGAGPGGFVLNYMTYKSEIARESQYAHSWLFQVVAELGLVGLTLMVTFWTSLAARAWQLVRSVRGDDDGNGAGGGGDDRREALWLVLAALALGFDGLFEYSIWTREFLIAAGLFAGLGCGLDAMARGDKPGQRRQWWFGGLFAAPLVLALWMTPPYQRALTAEWAGKDAESAAEARAAFARAAALQPDNPQFALEEASVAARMGDPGAGMMYRRALRRDPRSASGHAALGAWLRGHGDALEGLRELDRAIELYPSDVGYRLERAGLRRAAGDAAGMRADVDYIIQHKLPVWEYQQEELDELKGAAGLKTTTGTIQREP